MRRFVSSARLLGRRVLCVLLIALSSAEAAALPVVADEHSITLRLQKSYGGTTLWARPFPKSVTLSPDGRRLAVIAGGVDRLSDRAIEWLEVLDTTTGRLTRDFGYTYWVAVRWHPSKLALIATDGDADKPDYYWADLRTGRRRQLFRGDAHPFCWSPFGMLFTEAVVPVDPATGRMGRWGNFGFRIPWHTGSYYDTRRMSCGADGRVAVEIWTRYPARYLGMYRKVPRYMKWVRAGRIDPKLSGRKVIWYPTNPNFLADGRLVYLRVYPAQWKSLFTSDARPVPGAHKARNRAEVWVSSLDGKNQRRVLTLWHLRPHTEAPSADWFTIDRTGRTICYLDNKKIRVLRLAKPL